MLRPSTTVPNSGAAASAASGLNKLITPTSRADKILFFMAYLLSIQEKCDFEPCSTNPDFKHVR
jgi:hypothetical protein